MIHKPEVGERVVRKIGAAALSVILSLTLIPAFARAENTIDSEPSPELNEVEPLTIGWSSSNSDPIYGNTRLYSESGAGADGVVTTEEELRAALAAADNSAPHIIPIARAITLTAPLAINSTKNIVLRKVVVSATYPGSDVYWTYASGTYLVHKSWNYNNSYLTTNLNESAGATAPPIAAGAAVASPDLYDGEPDIFITLANTVNNQRHLNITAANTTFIMENITFLGAGTYQGESALEDSALQAQVSGKGGIAVNVTGCALSVNVWQSGFKPNSGSPAGGGLCLFGNSTQTLALKGGVIYRCATRPTSSTAVDGNGSGITISSSASDAVYESEGAAKKDVTITNTIIEQNAAPAYGGGILFASSSGSLTLNGSTMLRHNRARAAGGLMMLRGTLMVGSDAIVEGNTAESDAIKPSGWQLYPGLGGGIGTSSAAVTINVADNAQIKNNAAMRGGGGIAITNTSSTVNLTGGSFEGNIALGSYRELLDNDASNASSVNSIGGGGAIYAYDLNGIKIPAASTVHFANNKAEYVALLRTDLLNAGTVPGLSGYQYSSIQAPYTATGSSADLGVPYDNVVNNYDISAPRSIPTNLFSEITLSSLGLGQIAQPVAQQERYVDVFSDGRIWLELNQPTPLSYTAAPLPGHVFAGWSYAADTNPTAAEMQKAFGVGDGAALTAALANPTISFSPPSVHSNLTANFLPAAQIASPTPLVFAADYNLGTYVQPAAQNLGLINNGCTTATEVSVTLSAFKKDEIAWSGTVPFTVFAGGNSTIAAGNSASPDSSWAIQPAADLTETGVYTALATINYLDGSTAAACVQTQVAFVLVAANQAALVSSASDLDFGTVFEGYPAPVAHPLVLQNYGQGAATITSIELLGAAASSFTLAPATTTGTIPGRESYPYSQDDHWTIAPIAGLTAGTYQAQVKVCLSDGSTSAQQLSFVVNPAARLSVTDISLPSRELGYQAPAYNPIQISNTGGANAIIDSIASNAGASSVFSMGQGGSDIVGAAGSNTSLLLAPKKGLAAGDYVESFTLVYHTLGDDAHPLIAHFTVTLTVSDYLWLSAARVDGSAYVRDSTTLTLTFAKPIKMSWTDLAVSGAAIKAGSGFTSVSTDKLAYTLSIVPANALVAEGSPIMVIIALNPSEQVDPNDARYPQSYADIIANTLGGVGMLTANTAIHRAQGTVSFSVADAGAATGSSINATYEGAAVQSGAMIYGGGTLAVTATGVGAVSGNYIYAWSVNGVVVSEVGSVLTLSNVVGSINIACTVTGVQAAGSVVITGGSQAFVYGTTLVLAATGSGGALTWSSANNNYASIDVNTGALTWVAPGAVQITATRAATAQYAASSTSITLTVSNAEGAAISTVPLVSAKTYSSIVVAAAVASLNPGGQAIEYYCSTDINTPTGGAWQDGTAFSGLTANTTYYVFARSKAKTGYDAGSPRASLPIATNGALQGGVLIVGSLVYAETLTAVPALTSPVPGTLSYQWEADGTAIPGATATTYTVPASAIGKSLSVVVAAANYTGEVASLTTTNVAKRQLSWGTAGTVASKPYDGSFFASIVAVPELLDIANSDNVTLAVSASFASAQAGTSKAVNPDTWSIEGTAKDYYFAPTTAPSFTPADITKVDLALQSQTFYVVEGREDTYNFDLTTLLPVLSTGLEFGSVSYTASATTNAAGLLATLPTGALSSPLSLNVASVSGADRQATISVTVASDNFNFAQDAIISIVTTSKTPVIIKATINGGSYAGRPYDGTAYAYTDVEVRKTSDDTEVAGETLVVRYVGTGNTNYGPSATAPTNVGTYNLTLSTQANASYVGAVNYDFTITNASGAAITTPATELSKSYDAITVSPALASENPGNQSIEYYCSADPSVLTGGAWQDGTAFSGLSPNTAYYVFARTKAQSNYNAGLPMAGAAIVTYGLSTITFAVADAGAASGSSIAARYNGALVASGAQVPSGGALSITATGVGALSNNYSYLWSGSGSAGETAAVLHIALLTGDVNLTCTVTGLAAQSTTTIVGGDQTLVFAMPLTLAATGIGDGVVSWSIDSTEYASININTGELNWIMPGRATVTASRAATIQYAASSASIALTVVNTAGATVIAPATEYSKTDADITVASAQLGVNPGGQVIEYCCSTSASLPAEGSAEDIWQTDTTFTRLLPSTAYYIFARSQAKTGYAAGSPVASVAISTSANKAALAEEIGKAAAVIFGEGRTTLARENLATALVNASAVQVNPDATQAQVDNVLAALAIALDALYLDDMTAHFVNNKYSHMLGEPANLVYSMKHDYSLFAGTVKVDGVVLSEGAEFVAASGSTQITLQSAYLDTLAVGTHLLEVAFCGFIPAAQTAFVITPADSGSSSQLGDGAGDGTGASTPLTGDNVLQLILPIVLLAVLGLLFVFCAQRSKRRR